MRRRRHPNPTCATLAASLVVACPLIASAQTEPVIVQAESGTLGADFATASDGDVTYVTLATQDLTVVTDAPASDAKVITYSVTFPAAGEYELFARVFVETLAQSGQSPPDNDSFFYGSGFGFKMSGAGTGDDWILANGLFGVGTIAGDEVVEGGGGAGDGVWKWIDLSKFNGGEAPVTFTVPASALTQTFQIGGREDGLYIDKLAFGVAGLFYTVNALDNGLPGSDEPPPTFTQPGPPIATGQAKFLGNIYSPQQVTDFEKVWNQVTPENAGKWGSVEGTRGVFNWNELDAAFDLAEDNGFPFKQHTLIWGNQQPAWLDSLPPAEQLQAIQSWFAALAERYPNGFDFIDVVNEPLHNPPDGQSGRANYLEALGGAGATGWDWVITSFELARTFFPSAKLLINEFSVTNDAAAAARYLEIIKLLQADGLIDGIGIQGHAFETRTDMATQTANLNLLASTGLPIYFSELDVDGPDDEVQLADYQRIFPTFWLHPAVQGVTLWGWRPGMFRPTAFLVQSNGFERPAMVWLKEFVRAPTGTLLVCHEDKNITVSKHAVPDHLGHGDFLGNCN